VERAGFQMQESFAAAAPAVRFDAGALSQAIVNLLENAVKYSGESREIAVRLEADDTQVVVAVADHGPGIPESEQRRIFDRYYRAPNGAAKGGYGLGLFIVSHIMDAHGGRVELHSEPGRGSCFRLVLPAVHA
jgi:signal transduction histidine kinase